MRSQDSTFPEQIGDELEVFVKSLPHRSTPGIDCFVALGSCLFGQYLGCGYCASVCRPCEHRPRPFVILPDKVHVRALTLMSGELLFYVQVEAYQRER